MSNIKKIAIMTGGGDCPGLNPVIKAVVTTAIKKYGLEVVGVRHGYHGLYHGDFINLSLNDVREIITLGGTILYSSNKDNLFQYPVKDENGNISLVAPFDANFLPPAANWSIPFYLSGMELENYYTVTYGDGWTPAFPVEVSADRNTITIKPLVYDGKEFYPNMIGIDYSMNQTILENPVVSEIVLTRGWTEPAATRAMSSSAVRGKSIQPKGEFPKSVCKPMTELKATPELKTIEGKIVTVEEFKKRADKYVEMRFNQNN